MIQNLTSLTWAILLALFDDPKFYQSYLGNPASAIWWSKIWPILPGQSWQVIQDLTLLTLVILLGLFAEPGFDPYLHGNPVGIVLWPARIWPISPWQPVGIVLWPARIWPISPWQPWWNCAMTSQDLTQVFWAILSLRTIWFSKIWPTFFSFLFVFFLGGGGGRGWAAGVTLLECFTIHDLMICSFPAWTSLWNMYEDHELTRLPERSKYWPSFP